MKPNPVPAQLFKHLPSQCQCNVTAQLHTAWAGLGWAGLGWAGDNIQHITYSQLWNCGHHTLLMPQILWTLSL